MFLDKELAFSHNGLPVGIARVAAWKVPEGAERLEVLVPPSLLRALSHRAHHTVSLTLLPSRLRLPCRPPV